MTRGPMLRPSHSHPDARQNGLMDFGLEFEVPFSRDESTYFMARGKPTDSEDTDWFDMGELTHEWISANPSTHGWEARTTETRGPSKLTEWYEIVYNAIEAHEGRIEPFGYHGNGTAGLHVHMSALSEADARLLREVSTEPWMRLLACTSVVAYDTDGELLPKYHVLRGRDPDVKNPCKNKRVGSPGRNCLVAGRRGLGHYEWRLPEPMLPKSFERLMRAVTLLLDASRDAAKKFAMRTFEEHPEEVTAIKRARKIQERHGDLPAMKDERNDTTDLLLEVM